MGHVARAAWPAPLSVCSEMCHLISTRPGGSPTMASAGAFGVWCLTMALAFFQPLPRTSAAFVQEIRILSSKGMSSCRPSNCSHSITVFSS